MDGRQIRQIDKEQNQSSSSINSTSINGMKMSSPYPSHSALPKCCYLGKEDIQEQYSALALSRYDSYGTGGQGPSLSP